jgi:hypothetical protein
MPNAGRTSLAARWSGLAFASTSCSSVFFVAVGPHETNRRPGAKPSGPASQSGSLLGDGSAMRRMRSSNILSYRAATPLSANSRGGGVFDQQYHDRVSPAAGIVQRHVPEVGGWGHGVGAAHRRGDARLRGGRRKVGQILTLAGSVSDQGNRCWPVRFGFVAPADRPINRQEIWHRIREEQAEGAPGDAKKPRPR